jgi:triphosphoribosyl-dephospho-CoA synthase
MTADQFLLSASVSAGPLTEPGIAVGRRILDAIRATRQAVGTNTNLGIVLLCAPIICGFERGGRFRDGVLSVLAELNADDTAAVFGAIVLATPGGLGDADENDVRETPQVGLLEAMRGAAHRDRIAYQYASGFADIFELGVPVIQRRLSDGETGMWPTVAAYMAFLTHFPDSHIARKFGPEIAESVRAEAVSVNTSLAATEDEEKRIGLLMEFDARLKARGLNPGTSADLTVACLLVHNLREQLA